MTIQHTTKETSPAVSKNRGSRPDIPLPTSGWLTPKQAARYLNFSVSWLAKRRLEGNGPLYSKPHGAVRYDEVTLRQWMKSHQRNSTGGS